jgi:hypothetical protein
VEAPESLALRAKNFYHAHEGACTVALFVAGFLFDTLAVGRIDKPHNIVHQATYLLLCAAFISTELTERFGGYVPPPRFQRVWPYRNGATHFMLGTLLNIYMLFYFKSSSFGTSFLFLAVLAGLLAANELKPFESSGTTLRMTLFSLCLISYFTYLIPTLAGAIGWLPFIGTLAASTGCVAALFARLKSRVKEPRLVLGRLVVAPYACVALSFAVLYFAKVIPPVPLSLSEIGIYHDVKREGDQFILSELRPRWRFWEKGDQRFLARPGDALYCYASIFSPTRFKERLQVRWLYRDPVAGWEEFDAIPLDIAGGRDGGWRGFTTKTRWKPGAWRVKVETSDRRELGRIDLRIIADETTGPRTPHRLTR